MSDRLIAGMLTAIALCITAIAVVLILSIYRGGVSETIALWYTVPRLLLYLATAGFIAGALLGPVRAVTLLSHLWATAEPRRLLVTVFLWALVITLWLVAYAFTLHGQP